jgi:hypothetical protein
MHRQKSLWALLFVVLFGAIAGSAIGQALVNLVPVLARGVLLGLNPPAELDLYVLRLTLGVGFTLNVAGAVGVLLALFLYRR